MLVVFVCFVLLDPIVMELMHLLARLDIIVPMATKLNVIGANIIVNLAGLLVNHVIPINVSHVIIQAQQFVPVRLRRRPLRVINIDATRPS